MPSWGETWKQITDMPEAELMQWIIAFAIAYIIIEHGGEIIGGLGKGLGSIVSMLTLASA